MNIYYIMSVEKRGVTDKTRELTIHGDRTKDSYLTKGGGFRHVSAESGHQTEDVIRIIRYRL